MKRKTNGILLIAFLILGLALTLFEIFFWFGTPGNKINEEEYSYVMVDDIAIAYTKVGKGPAIVLLHSGAASSIEFNPIIEDLRDTYTIYAIDMVGFGYSDKPQVTYTLEYLTDMTARAIEQLPEKHIHILGTSIGGSVAVQLAAEYPKKISTVTLVNPFGFGQDIDQSAILAQVPLLSEMLFYPNRVTFDYVLEHGIVSELSKERRRELFAISRLPKAGRAKLSVLRSTITARGVRPDVQQQMDAAAVQVQQPVLLLWSENDAYTPPQQADHAKELMPQAKLIWLQDTGHFAHIEAPTNITKELRLFFSELYDNQPEE